VKLHRDLTLTAFAALATMAFAQSNANRVAVVNGQTITQEELDKAAANDLRNLETKRLQNDATMAQDKQQVLTRALEQLAADKLIEAEAKKLNMSKEQLLDAEVTSNVETPSDSDVEGFYNANKDRIPIPKEQALPQVKQYLIERSRSRYHDALITRLKKQYGFKSYLEPLRAKIETAGFPSTGPATAAVTIVEFSDFECPFCGGLYPTLKQIEKNYAEKAAEASLCANEQQHFWEFHDSMFGNQKELSVADLKQRAVDLKLDTAKFNECLDSGRQVAAIQSDLQEGARAGVTGTPALFINGRMLSGNQPYSEIKEIIDDELQRSPAAK